jgi:hypothetical protein
LTEGPLPLRDENVLLAGVVEAISAGLELGPLAARIAGLIVTATAKGRDTLRSNDLT